MPVRAMFAYSLINTRGCSRNGNRRLDVKGVTRDTSANLAQNFQIRACRLLSFVRWEGCSITRTGKSIASRKSVISAVLESLRLHQWAKNLLIFVPLILAGKGEDINVWAISFIGFIALGILASSSYILNDLLDVSFDRDHWSKQHRPLPRGDLPVTVALTIVPIGMLTSFAIAASLSRGATILLLIYTALTLSYSLRLKRIPILDVLILAALFTFRLVFGIQVGDIRPSPWLLIFSMFLFMSLSLAKRYTEVRRNGALGRDAIRGRGYVAKDAPLLHGLGLSAAAGAILIMILYLTEEAFAADFYGRPVLLWFMPAILLLWLGRIWLLAGRDELDDDPLWFAVRDRVNLILGAAMVIAFLSAWQL
jgi:4-hydroxybenzoate polyprenyltransferase